MVWLYKVTQILYAALQHTIIRIQQKKVTGIKKARWLHIDDTFPIKAEDPPRRAMPTATLAGAPPGAFLKAGASANARPLIVGTKSISISPKQTTSEDSSASGNPLSLGSAFPKANKKIDQGK